MCLRVKKRKNTHLWLLLSLPLLCVTFKSSINLTLLPECQRSDPHFLPFRQWEQDRAWKASSCTTYFLLYYRSPGNVGTALPPGYLFTFSLQDYIGIIIVFCGVFFSCLALFKGPLDPERWRKMAPFWGIWLLRKKIQRHTGSFISVFFFFFFLLLLLLCFPSGANLQRRWILDWEWNQHKHNQYLWWRRQSDKSEGGGQWELFCWFRVTNSHTCYWNI